MIDNDEILQIFFSEAEELLKLAETSLMSLESTPDSASDIEELFRSLHTLKSSAAMTGFTSISEYSHLLETLLERLRTHKLSVTKNLITMMLESLDFMKSMVDRAVRGVAEANSDELRMHREQVSRYLGLDTMAQSPGNGRFRLDEALRGNP